MGHLVCISLTIYCLLCVVRNEALRVAFIHVEESGATDGKIEKHFYSKLVKADVNGKDQVWKLIGDQSSEYFLALHQMLFLLPLIFVLLSYSFSVAVVLNNW